MEIIHISESKLKVMLTQEDLEDFGIDAQALDYNDVETKELFGALLSHIKDTADFNTDGYRLLVRLFPSRDGSCELFLSRIDAFAPPQTEPSLEADPHFEAFRFDSIDALLAVCRRLRAVGFDRPSTAYMSDGHRFYLLLEQENPSKHKKSDGISPTAFLCEYGKAESDEGLLGFLLEHGRLLCTQSAVERLGVL